MIRSDLSKTKDLKTDGVINNLAVNVIITIVVTTTEDQKLCWFKNGSYVNESPLLTWSNSTETQIQS
jgi:hypothetical protein